MAKPTGNKSAPPPKPASKLLLGVLAGMVLGVGLAAVVAWYVVKSPSPIVQKSSIENKPSVVEEKPKATTEVAPKPKASTDTPTENGKPRFDFYKVLTGKQDGAATPPIKHENPVKAADATVQVLQAGSFSNVDDAEKLKAKLALLGVEANVQTAAIPDKGVWYRVRLGPYKNVDELSKARDFLKQNGVDSTPLRAQ